MGNEYRQAHLGIWFGDGAMVETWQPPIDEDADDPKKTLGAVVAKTSEYDVIPTEGSVRVSLKGNVVIEGATINGDLAVIRPGDVADVLFDGTDQPVSIKFISTG